MQSSNHKYKIVFAGEIQQGQDLLSVKTRLASMLSATGDMIDHLFIDQPVLVRGNLSLDNARLFQMKFEKTGAKCQLLEASSIPIPAQKVASLPTEKPPSPPPSPPVQPVKTEAVVKPVSESVQSTPSGTAQINREFTFRKPEKQSKMPIILAVIAGLIIISVVINVTDRNRQYSEVERYRLAERIDAQTKKDQQKAAKANLLDSPLKEFSDPKKYYIVELPGGYKVSNKSSGNRSKISFVYTNAITVTIIASPMHKAWEPDIEMAKRVQAIQSGRVGPLSGYQLERSILLGFNNMSGYELVLTRGTNIAHAFAMVSDSNIAFSVTIVTMGNNSREYHEILETAIRDSLFPN